MLFEIETRGAVSRAGPGPSAGIILVNHGPLLAIALGSVISCSYLAGNNLPNTDLVNVL